MTIDPDDEPDSQDLAEVFDETHTTEDGEDIANPDMAPNVYDVTYEDGDADDSEAADEDFDPDLATDDELDELLDRDDGVDDDEPVGPDDEDRVTTDDEEASDYETDELSDAELERSGYETEPRPGRRKEEAELDESLEDSFPASDPPSMIRGAD
jgi:hypothetical protein